MVKNFYFLLFNLINVETYKTYLRDYGNTNFDTNTIYNTGTLIDNANRVWVSLSRSDDDVTDADDDESNPVADAVRDGQFLSIFFIRDYGKGLRLLS